MRTKNITKLCRLCPSHKDDYCGRAKSRTQDGCQVLTDMSTGYKEAIKDVKKEIDKRVRNYDSNATGLVIGAEYGIFLSILDDIANLKKPIF